MPIGSALLDKAMQRIGSWININVGSDTYDTSGYGAGSLTFTAFSGEGYVQVLTDFDDSVRAGVLGVGDAIAYFRMNATLPLGSKMEITHQGVNYETISDPIIPHISGNQLLKQVNLRRKVN